ncbi:thioredoxin domain-containing protein [Sandaracinomonas limnophila]|uniref:Thioredoxin domain-containing protein n=1 Tax=Sandaracinomonas limnophila TaxID=1862386 RepID=A0A437PWQ4_9BACT|nr:thioredoxin domain-containing protein [Sandaracinomonas limnophila]RVU26683.1 thioredoxin domain-containing protein [Sandaracinomonas limnophila]
MNKLANQVSPYLLQHKNNPVNWQPWSDEALQEAFQKDKPIILSIGYSACHWCHVMEKESFENVEIAQLMNEHFINIKVDREERPDIDFIYMDAIHAMGLQGGWPLNVFLMPDQKPFYGGTYFPKNKWKELLNSISSAYKNHKLELQNSANGFGETLNAGLHLDSKFESLFQLENILQNIRNQIDPHFGGLQRAPKFPMPSLWNLLESLPKSVLKYSNLEILQNLTLDKMAQGGIYDQVEGGFSRYSVDSEWFCPHFEKMLYDNGQLISIYSKAYQRTQKDLYAEVIYQTINFHSIKMKSTNGLYYAALDADSEGEEGKYYVWTFEELNSIIPLEQHVKFYEHFSISKNGNWEASNNILFKKDDTLNELFEKELNILRHKRNQRIAPGLDNKHILSWNAMYLIGLIDSYKALESDFIFEELGSLYKSIEKNFFNNHQLLHQTQFTNKPIPAFLDDLAFWALANVRLFLIFFDPVYLKNAEQILSEIISDFYDEKIFSFSYSNRKTNQLIANKTEWTDSVIPSSNSVVVEVLFWMGILKNNAEYTLLAKQILEKILPKAIENPTYFSNWLRIHCEWIEFPKMILKIYDEDFTLEDNLLSNENLEIIKYKDVSAEKKFMLCCGDRCLQPTNSIEELKSQLNELTI